MTGLFWGIVAVMTCIGLYPIIRALRGDAAAAVRDGTERVTLAIYRQRLVELEREQAQGVIDAGQEQAARAELERTLLAETAVEEGGAATPAAAPGGEILAYILLGLLVPVIAIFLYNGFGLGVYRGIGRPDLITRLAEDAMQAPDQPGHGTTAPAVEAMVEALARRMEANPDDEQGLYLLARSYSSMRKFSEAADTYARLYRLTGDRVDVLLPYADTLAMASGGRVAGLPEQLAQKALQQEPDNTMGLWLVGLGAYENGDYQAGIEYFQRLLALVAADPRESDQVRGLIDKGREELGEAPLAPASTAVAGEQAPAALTGPTVEVHVSLSAELAGRARPDQLVYIYAQAVNGPPMPVAVVRKQVSELPVEVLLDDSMAMMPTQKLSNFEQVKISARISSSGIANTQSGDLTAESKVVEVAGAGPVRLEINQAVP